MKLSSLSLPSLHVKEYKPEQIIYNKDKPKIKNENFTLYDGITDGIGSVTLLPLFNYKNNHEAMSTIISTINTMLSIKTPSLLSLLGYAINKSTYILIFEPIVSTLESALFSLSDDDKYNAIIDMMELISSMHEQNFKVLDIKPSNILTVPKSKQRKIIFPIESISIFTNNQSDDDEILSELINNDDFNIIRYTPPERVSVPPIVDTVNDIWMLGCLMIEVFSRSKVWEDQSETMIIKSLKALSIPKIPRDINKENWGIICECLNPFYQTRIDIRDVFIRMDEVISKNSNLKDAKRRLRRIAAIKGIGITLEGEDDFIDSNEISNTSIGKDRKEGNYEMRRCYSHPKFNIDGYCEKCKEVVCPKCKADTRHSQHSESILQIKDFIDMTLKQIGVFKSKFEGFVNENSRNYPIDAESIKEFISKQKKIVAKITNDEMKHIQSQFELFHKQIDILKQIEIENANSYHSFFLSKISSFEQSVIDLNNEINRIKQSLSKQIDYLTNFSLLSPNKKSDLIRDIPLSKELLREDKKTITNKIKEYHSLYSHISKTKKYYYRMVNNKNESKPYQFIKALIKLSSQMNSIYLTQNINDLLSQVIIENDNFSLINSRNYLTSKYPYVNIACFNSKKVMSFDVLSHTTSLIEVDFTPISPITLFPIFSRSISHHGILYINGGFDETSNTSLNYHIKYDHSSSSLSRLADMLSLHSAHSISPINESTLCVVSGSGTFKCEIYNEDNNSWKAISDVNFQRQNATMFVHNEMYLYIFGGLCYDDIRNEFVFVETVERIDISDIDNSKWEIVNAVKTNEYVDIEKSVMCAIAIDVDKILLVGGMKKDQSYSDDVMMYNFQKNEFSLVDDVKLEKKACFPSKQFLFFSEFAYQFDNEGDIHEFDVKECKFKLVSYSKQ